MVSAMHIFVYVYISSAIQQAFKFRKHLPLFYFHILATPKF